MRKSAITEEFIDDKIVLLISPSKSLQKSGTKYSKRYTIINPCTNPKSRPSSLSKKPSILFPVNHLKVFLRMKPAINVSIKKITKTIIVGRGLGSVPIPVGPRRDNIGFWKKSVSKRGSSHIAKVTNDLKSPLRYPKTKENIKIAKIIISTIIHIL